MNKKFNKIEHDFGPISKKYYNNFIRFYNKKYQKTYLSVLDQYSHNLNLYHQTNLSKKGWEIIIGPWLNSIINIYLYYNFLFKKKNLSKLHAIKSKIINIDISKDKFDPLFFEEYFTASHKKSFYFNLIKIILGFNLNKNKFAHKARVTTVINSYFKIIYLKIISLFPFINFIYLSHSRFKKKDLLRLFIKSFFRIIPYPILNRIFKFKKYFLKSQRDRNYFLGLFNVKHKNFIVSKTILYFMPSAYLENFNILSNLGKQFSNKPKKLYTDSSHIFDDILKIQISRWNIKNFYIGQHGGNLPLYNSNLVNFDDYSLSDRFITWGTKKKKKEFYLPSVRINNFLKISNSINNKKLYQICYIFKSIIASDYRSQFETNQCYVDIIKNKKFFFKNLKKTFCIKTYIDKNRYPYQLNDNDIANLLMIKKNKIINNSKIIFKSEILVFDYLSTMIFEILNLNIPFILIFNNKDHTLSKDGKLFINELSKLGILFPTHSKAVNFLNDSHNLVSSFKSKKFKSALKKISKKYANTSNNFINDWTNFLLNK